MQMIGLCAGPLLMVGSGAVRTANALCGHELHLPAHNKAWGFSFFDTVDAADKDNKGIVACRATSLPKASHAVFLWRMDLAPVFCTQRVG